MSTTISAPQTRQLVVFRLGAEEYGVDISLVQEIIRYTAPRPVPGNGPDIEGVINLRGRIIPVLDLAGRLGRGGSATAGVGANIVVCELPETTVGLVVDEVSEVLTVGAERIENVPDGSVRAGQDSMEGLVKLEGRLLVILDLARLLAVA